MHTILSVLPRAAAAGSLLLASLVVADATHAQAIDPRWQPWLGCWVPGETVRVDAPDQNTAGGLVCVVPAAKGAGVDLATIANGVVVHRERLNPTGARAAKTVDNCPGWESATWSADNRRLFVRSELVCGNNVTVRGSSVFAISAQGEWILVQGSAVGASATARVVRYQEAGLALAPAPGGVVDESTPVHLVAVTPGLLARSIRSAAGEAVRPEDVLEVARSVDGPVAEAWLNEIEQRFTVNAAQLVRLADAGMPPTMIDLMVALSYPERFALKRTELARSDLGRRESLYGSGAGYGRLNGYGARWDCGLGSRMLSYGYYGDGCYPWYYGLGGYGYGYGYGSYGYGGYTNGYYWGQQPIVVIDRPPENAPSRGRAVNGSGYTRGSSASGGSTARDHPYNPPPSTGGSSSGSSTGSSSSTSGSSTSGSSSSGGGGGDRTAKPRVPPG